MSRTLNLCTHLLTQGRNYHTLGADSLAQRTLTRLARLRDLPAPVAEEAQGRLAELMLKQGKFAQARRHLAAALSHDPKHAPYHHLMAIALEEDRRGNRDLCLEHYRRCVELDPENAGYLCDAGLFALRHGAVDEGLSYLRRAVELAADDAELIGEVVRGLQDEEQFDEARGIARTCLFQNGRDVRFHRLWNDCRFQELHHDQRRSQHRKAVRRAVAEGRICLPFEQLTVETPRGRKLVRRDGASRAPAPHLLRLKRLSGKKHA
jgi:Tfp pilus assembly protein PilF